MSQLSPQCVLCIRPSHHRVTFLWGNKMIALQTNSAVGQIAVLLV